MYLPEPLQILQVLPGRCHSIDAGGTSWDGPQMNSVVVFLVADAGGVLKVHVVELVHRKARDLTHRAGLHHGVAESRSPCLMNCGRPQHAGSSRYSGADDHPAAMPCGTPSAAQLGALGGHDAVLV